MDATWRRLLAAVERMYGTDLQLQGIAATTPFWE
jgi:hypothetical protein